MVSVLETTPEGDGGSSAWSEVMEAASSKSDAVKAAQEKVTDAAVKIQALDDLLAKSGAEGTQLSSGRIGSLQIPGFFSAFRQKLNLPKNPKTRFSPNKLDFRRQKLDFSDKMSTICPFFAPENCNESQNQ